MSIGGFDVEECKGGILCVVVSLEDWNVVGVFFVWLVDLVFGVGFVEECCYVNGNCRNVLELYLVELFYVLGFFVFIYGFFEFC